MCRNLCRNHREQKGPAEQRFTRRLWEWEAGDGTAARWARRLGAEAMTGPMRAWQLITGTHQESLVNPRK